MISIKNLIIRALAVGLLAMAAMAGLLAPASAAQRIPATGRAAAAVPTAVPIVKIVPGPPVAWMPNPLPVTPVKGRAKIIIDNTTTMDQVITDAAGKPLFTVKAMTKQTHIIDVKKGGTAQLVLQSSGDILTIEGQ